MFKPISNQLLTETINKVSQEFFNKELIFSGNSINFQVRLPITVEDEAYPVLYLKNKNDGKTALRINIGYHRIICMNGLIVPGAGYSARIIHRQGPKLDEFIYNLEDNIRVAFNQVIIGFSGFKQDLESIKLTPEQGINLIGWLPMAKKAKEQALRFWLLNSYRRPEDQGYTAWQLYNLINELDRIYSKNYNSIINREETRVEDIYLLTQEYQEVA